MPSRYITSPPLSNKEFGSQPWIEYFNRLDGKVNTAEVLLKGEPLYFDEAQSMFLQYNAGADSLRLTITSVGEFEWDGTAFYPIADGANDLGKTALRWKTVFSDDITVTNDIVDDAGNDFTRSSEGTGEDLSAKGSVGITINGTQYNLLYSSTETNTAGSIAISPSTAIAQTSASVNAFIETEDERNNITPASANSATVASIGGVAIA